MNRTWTKSGAAVFSVAIGLTALWQQEGPAARDFLSRGYVAGRMLTKYAAKPVALALADRVGLPIGDSVQAPHCNVVVWTGPWNRAHVLIRRLTSPALDSPCLHAGMFTFPG